MPRGSKPTDLVGQRFGRLTALERTATYITGRKPMWRCKCDCGKETLAISQCLVNGTTQSCGCLRNEFLTLGPMAAKILGRRPQAVKINYPVPENLHHKPEVNDIMRRMMQYRWERVEFEARQIERGTWKEPACTPLIPLDDSGNRVEKLDLRALAQARNAPVRVPSKSWTPIPEAPASFNTGLLARRPRASFDRRGVGAALTPFYLKKPVAK
jgi:hypothetical protein